MSGQTHRVLGIDPGEKKIGTALSDPTATIANPLSVLQFSSRDQAAEMIIELAQEHKVRLIVIGLALDWDGKISFQGRKARRLAGAVRNKTSIPVVLWNEYGSTQKARQARVLMGVSRDKRQGHLDDLAATVILQNYLDARESD